MKHPIRNSLLTHRLTFSSSSAAICCAPGELPLDTCGWNCMQAVSVSAWAPGKLLLDTCEHRGVRGRGCTGGGRSREACVGACGWGWRWLHGGSCEILHGPQGHCVQKPAGRLCRPWMTEGRFPCSRAKGCCRQCKPLIQPFAAAIGPSIVLLTHPRWCRTTRVF